MRLTLVCVLLALSNVTLADEPIGQGLSGQALRQHLRTGYSPTTILSYHDARSRMFETIDDLDGDNEIVGVYTGTTYYTVSIPDPDDVNCEHTWPQSRFSGSGMRTDIHHLYPTFSVINSTRGNKPFGEINDSQVDDWCGPGNNRSETRPAGNIDGFSESDSTHFEPREAHKGNVARSMFYFATIYEHRNSEPDWQQWFQAQVPTLKTWHTQDPVDQAERDRTLAISGVQGNVNPFVLDPTLVERVFGPSDGTAPADGDFDEESDAPFSPAPAGAGAPRILSVLANPAGEDGGRERVVLSNAHSQTVSLNGWLMRDAAGHTVQLHGRSIQPLSTLVIELANGQMPLNNDGDTVELVDPNGNVLDRVSYSQSEARSGQFISFN